MAVTTFRSFVDALEALDIDGVVRTYDSGPPAQSPSTADTPAQYVRLPSSDEIPLVLGLQVFLLGILQGLFLLPEFDQLLQKVLFGLVAVPEGSCGRIADMG